MNAGLDFRFYGGYTRQLAFKATTRRVLKQPPALFHFKTIGFLSCVMLIF